MELSDPVRVRRSRRLKAEMAWPWTGGLADRYSTHWGWVSRNKPSCFSIGDRRRRSKNRISTAEGIELRRPAYQAAEKDIARPLVARAAGLI